VVLASLSALNLFWFSKLLRMGSKMIADYTPPMEHPSTAPHAREGQDGVAAGKGIAGGAVRPVFEIQVSAGNGGLASRPGPARTSAVADPLTSGGCLFWIQKVFDQIHTCSFVAQITGGCCLNLGLCFR